MRPGAAADRDRGVVLTALSLVHTLILVIGLVFTRRLRTVRATAFGERQLEYARRRSCAGSAPASCSSRSCRTHSLIVVEATVRLGYAISRSPGSRSSASECSRLRPTGRCRSPTTTRPSSGTYWWTVLFGLGHTTLVIGSTVDGLQQVVDE
jgi:hypothetical protein